MPKNVTVAAIPVTAAAREAIAIWEAGVRAVDPAERVADCVRYHDKMLTVGGEDFGPFSGTDTDPQILVVGGGKAGAAMARGFETALEQTPLADRYSGWVNVPADCVGPQRRIHLHSARPAGVNEPTEAGVVGSEHLLDSVAKLQSRDLCVVLLSGGGSALLPAPREGISLADKLAVTRFLSRAGASIHELNTVRQHLSRIKGGGLLRACGAKRMVVLVLSDVIGNPLSVIASGPTILPQTRPIDALAVLAQFGAHPPAVPDSLFRTLKRLAQSADESLAPPSCQATHRLIGSNQIAVDASARAAAQRGYRVRVLGADQGGVAREVGVELAALCLAESSRTGPGICLISGGEPVVRLTATDRPQKGGRNQELVLAALRHLGESGLARISLVSGGTDGEDGPTDAAGAVADSLVWSRAAAQKLDPAEFLHDHNSYAFFAAANGLLKTGPTHTNVMDIRVAVISP